MFFVLLVGFLLFSLGAGLIGHFFWPIIEWAAWCAGMGTMLMAYGVWGEPLKMPWADTDINE